MRRKMVVGLLIVGIALIGGGVWVRVMAIDNARFEATPGPEAVGDHKLMGGAKSVRALTDLPDAAFQKLLAQISETPRTNRIGSQTTPASFVTRSAVFGFPDVTVVWVADGNLHIHGHLVYGGSDLGVNSARIRKWWDALGQR